MSFGDFSKIIRGMSFNDSWLNSLQWINVKGIFNDSDYDNAILLLEEYDYDVYTTIDSD